MPTVSFASIRIMREFNDIDHRLYEIVMLLLERYWPDAAVPARIVCIWRTEQENEADGAKTTIHCQPAPYRAVDVGAREFDQTKINEAAAAINALWQYDPARPELLVCFAQPHGTGPHFHCQVHPNTRKR
jgi:hypothetical protein